MSHVDLPQCRVEWAEIGGGCSHDRSAACPFGWYPNGDECLAPLTYDVCSNRKSFGGVTPAAKGDWAQNCKVEWPCRERRHCSKAYSAPCPADWYAFNGGASCASPPTYGGNCAPVLHGLLDLTNAEKVAIEGKCEFDWPCAGEVYASVLQAAGDSAAPRRSIDPARYAAANGPIDSQSGAIRTRPC